MVELTVDILAVLRSLSEFLFSAGILSFDVILFFLPFYSIRALVLILPKDSSISLSRS